jgi:hypothetical protein
MSAIVKICTDMEGCLARCQNAKCPFNHDIENAVNSGKYSICKFIDKNTRQPCEHLTKNFNHICQLHYSSKQSMYQLNTHLRQKERSRNRSRKYQIAD